MGSVNGSFSSLKTYFFVLFLNFHPVLFFLQTLLDLQASAGSNFRFLTSFRQLEVLEIGSCKEWEAEV